MLELDAKNLNDEILDGTRLRDEKIKHWKAIIDQQISGGVSDTPGASSYPENHVHEYLTLMVPRIVSDNPRCKVGSRRQVADSVLEQFKSKLLMAVLTGRIAPPQAEQLYEQARKPNLVSLATQSGLNQWIVDTNYQCILDRVCYDVLMAFGVLMTTREVMPGADPYNSESNRWPGTVRISPRRFVMDPTALHESEARWKAHLDFMDKETLLKKAKTDPKDMGWDIDAIERLVKIEAPDDLQKDKAGFRIDRKMVSFYTMHIPEYTQPGWPGPDDGYNGALVVLANCRIDGEAYEHGIIRKPRPFFGPACGPYSLIGAYVEADSPFPLSPLAATFSQSNELNLHAKAMSASAAQYKRGIIVSAKNTKLIAALRDRKDMAIIPVESEMIDPEMVIPFEVGGISDPQLKHFALFRDRLDRLSGMDDAQRGNVTGDGTATENAIADSSSETRVSYIRRKYTEGVRRDLWVKGWYLWHDPNVEYSIGPELSEQLGMLQPTFRGGQDDDVRYEEMSLVIDPYSMARTSEASYQRNAMLAFQLISGAAPAMMQYPYIDWKDLLRTIGDALNMPELPDSVDFAMLQQMAQMQQMATMMGGGGQPGGPPSGQAMSGQRMLQSQPGKVDRGQTTLAKYRGQSARHQPARV